jgi:hypothetical protein
VRPVIMLYRVRQQRRRQILIRMKSFSHNGYYRTPCTKAASSAELLTPPCVLWKGKEAMTKPLLSQV